MDPITLAIALGLTGIGPVVQGVADATADRGAQQRNKKELEKLLGQEARGALVDPEEVRLMDQQFNAPVQVAAGQAKSRAEQIAASLQSATAQDLSRLRQEQTQTHAAGAQAAAIAVSQAKALKEAQKKLEIEQRLQAKAAYKRDDIAKILGPLSDLAGKAGMLAGAPPGFAQSYGMFGTLYSPSELQSLQTAYQSDPEGIQKKLLELLKKSGVDASAEDLAAAGAVA